MTRKERYHSDPEFRARCLAARRKYVLANKEKVIASKKRHYQKNRDSILIARRSESFRKDSRERAKKWRAANLERSRAARRAYYWRHRERLKLQRESPEFRLRHRLNAQRRRETPRGKVENSLRRRLHDYLRRGRAVKTSCLLDLVGCSFEQLVGHLESMFKPGMSWETHGLRGWHIDHVKPCSSFDLTDPAQQRECFHYSNLQPLWWKDNISKGGVRRLQAT